jgi:GTPase
MSTPIKKNLPTVVIFGRTNVGKSTLFNCLLEKRQAITSDIAGTTRDSNVGVAEWSGRQFELVDTGGIINLDRFLEKNHGRKPGVDMIQDKIEAQAKTYLKKADLILFVLDGKDGLLPIDRELANLLKKLMDQNIENVVLVVNKIDNFRRQGERASEFYKLAMGEPISISATTGAGTGDMLDAIIARLPKEKKKKEEEEAEEIRVIMIGKPNVGKSSLLNSLLGEERVIVSPVAHTTREPQDTVIRYKDRQIRLVDTAGLSRKGQQVGYKKKHKNQLERFGIAKSLHSLDEANITLLVLDINDELTHQDAKIVEEIVNRKKSLIIIANKWDLIEEKNVKDWTRKIYMRLPFVQWAPILFVSASTGSKTNKILDLILQVSEERKREISASILNTFLMKLVKMHKPTKGKGFVNPRIRRFEQVGINPPLFEVRIGAKESLHDSYTHYITNRLREKFGFTGTPISIWVSKKRKVHGMQEHGRDENNTPGDLISIE